jgi:hypothetical protein
MEIENPYLPPSAPLEIKPPGGSYFYIVSMTKFWCLFMLTMGGYQLYWNYKHWANIKKAKKLDCLPVARALFSMFFYHSMTAEIESVARQNRVQIASNLRMIATFLVIVTVVSSISSRLGSKIGLSIVALQIAPILLVPVIGFLLATLQKAANEASLEDGSRNASFTALNYIWMVLGAVLWMLCFVGMTVLVSGG